MAFHNYEITPFHNDKQGFVLPRRSAARAFDPRHVIFCTRYPIITWMESLPEMHRRVAWRWSAAAGLVQDPFDLADRNSKDLGDLRDGHAVLQPDAHPGNL
jgi:hypothetical protein